MDVVGKGDGSGLGWISLYSNEPCTYAFFKVEYSGGLGVLCNSAWVLTEDGDEDADTGVIPGEGGLDACGPWAGPGDPALKVAVHVLPHADRSCTRDFPVITTCSDIVSTCGANDVDFFPVFYGFQEYHCFEYSVEWPGSYSCIFTPCTYTSLGDIVWPAGTVPEEDWTDRIWQCFEGCLENPIAIPGWGWVYEPGPAVIRIVGNSASHFITVSDCSEDLYLPSCSFAAGIGGASGEEPCGPSSTEPKSWGSIKALFR
jgi:hypothetical protein